MTDLEICRRLAEIDNRDTTLISHSDECGSWLYCNETGDEYNPLSDNAICFKLIVDYNVEIEFDSDLNFVCACNNVWVNDENLNKAICLAIINSH